MKQIPLASNPINPVEETKAEEKMAKSILNEGYESGNENDKGTLSLKPLTSQDIAQDTISFDTPTSEEVSSPKISTLSSSISSDDAVDPITKAIREEILEKQREILRLGTADKNPELARQLENDEKFREFLGTLNAEQRKLVDEALKDEKIKKQLEAVEIAGYKKVHTDFKDSFKTIEWDGLKGEDASKNTTRSQTITNGVGKEIATLTETTHAITPITVLDGSNKAVTIKSYRTIDFPTKFDENAKGSMHLSMVALDENGNRPPVDQAVYFTAHYEEGPGGKPLLKEVSSPMPIKFNGPGEDALGYVEHGGKIYTMPVTRGKYEEMMKEVEKNKGQSVNLSQTVEISQDHLIGADKGAEIPEAQHNKVELSIEQVSPPLIPPKPLEQIEESTDLSPSSQKRNSTKIASTIRNNLSSSAPLISSKSSSQQIIDEYKKQNTFDEKKAFIESKLVNNKDLSKEERLGMIDKLTEQQNKRRSEVVEGTLLKGEAATTSVSSEKTELKPISKDDPSIEKSRREVVIDKANVKDDVKIRGVLMEARSKINEEPGRSIKTLSQSSKNKGVNL